MPIATFLAVVFRSCLNRLEMMSCLILGSVGNRMGSVLKVLHISPLKLRVMEISMQNFLTTKTY